MQLMLPFNIICLIENKKNVNQKWLTLLIKLFAKMRNVV